MTLFHGLRSDFVGLHPWLQAVAPLGLDEEEFSHVL
jgi:hypothetical protein